MILLASPLKLIPFDQRLAQFSCGSGGSDPRKQPVPEPTEPPQPKPPEPEEVPAKAPTDAPAPNPQDVPPAEPPPPL